MTKINKVELSGFKSFRKRLAIPFFPGVTAIVGENGSGKSNLFDAIRFVMGRRSSQIRADRMEHLIFNGGEQYPAEDTAEVVLYLENDGGRFDRFLENGEGPAEVAIGRRITRKSASYTFMGKNCPRTTIDEVLQAAQIDPDGQQLIAQGTITEIIRRSPLRRREILDEVSGIAAYDEKRRKAIGELKDVKTKLNTHRVILAERRRRLLSLQHERDAALEYQRLGEEQERLALSIQHKRREGIQEKLEKARQERVGMDERIAEFEQQVTGLDTDIENKEWELEGLQENLAGEGQITLIKALERARSDIMHKQSEISLKRQQTQNLQEMIDEITRMREAESLQKAGPVGTSRANPAVQGLLDRKRGGVYGTIETLGKVRSGFEAALDTSIGGHRQDVVVDSRETAIDCINHLKERRLGRARILPLRRLVTARKSLASAEALKLPGVIDYAINLVEFDDKYRRAFEYVLGDTVIAETLEAVRGVDGVRVVTLDGDQLSKGGAVSGGWRPQKDAKSPGKSSNPADSSFDVTRRRQQISKLRKEIESLEDEVAELQARLAEKEKELTSQQADKDRAKGEASSRSDELRDLREKRREAYQGLENLRRSLTRYERQEAEAEAELEALGAAPDVDPKTLVDAPLSQLERQLDASRRRMRRLEPVNMRAIDEYTAYEEEYNVFRERVDALESEKREIERLIGDIEERKRQRFLEVLTSVDTAFDRIFQQLFEGGSASLALDIENDISSGLLIRANPPDKEPHLIDALSGGEQTLVAIAFVFALQEHQKAPFFVLDEIDAALDLMNTTRLARMIKEYSDRIQVIVVSHNEETVRHADRAYGVTIKNGVSEVLALNLN